MRCSTRCPAGCVVDGEIVIVTPRGLDFDALQLRLHPAAIEDRQAREGIARVVRRVRSAGRGRQERHGGAAARPARDARSAARGREAAALSDADDAAASAGRGLARSNSRARDWTASSSSRSTRRICRASARCSRSSTCAPRTASWPAFAGTRTRAMRWARCCSACTTTTACSITSASPPRSRWRCGAASRRRSSRCARTRWTSIPGASGRAKRRTRPRGCPAGRAAGRRARTCRGKPLRIERVCEVKYDHLQGDRFRHAAHFLRWRPDKPPAACRYDQLEVTTPYALKKVFGAAGVSGAGMAGALRGSRRLRAPARREGCTRVGSPGAFAYCGGHGASPWPSLS